MKKRTGVLGKVLLAVAILLAAALGILVYRLEVLPMKYFAVLAAGLLVICALLGALLWNMRHRARFLLGVLLWLLFVGTGILGGKYLYDTEKTITTLTSAGTEVSQIGVYLRIGDRAESLSDTAEYRYGILADLDSAATRAAVADLNEKLGTEIQTSEYPGITELMDALTKEEIDAVLMNTQYVELVHEMEGYENLEESVRELVVENVESPKEKDEKLSDGIELEEPVTETDSGAEEQNDKTSASAAAEVSPADMPEDKQEENENILTVYISGIDNRGGIIAKSRSDTNIIIVANMETKQAVMISTPRDYYVPLSISNGVPDKLTHAGIYGVDVSMDTLGMLYDLDIDYYVKVNFGGFVNIIDALGGITVYSDYEFDSKNELGWHFNQGENDVDGEAALVFARERYSFSEGDRQRGKNQMAVIRGIMDKLVSTDLLKNYSALLSSLSGSFETNIPYTMITKLIKAQVNDLEAWNLVSYSVDGTGSTEKTYSMSMKSSVMIPDQATVDHAKALIAKIKDGEIVTQE